MSATNSIARSILDLPQDWRMNQVGKQDLVHVQQEGDRTGAGYSIFEDGSILLINPLTGEGQVVDIDNPGGVSATTILMMLMNLNVQIKKSK